ncbi:MAG: trigger factor [Acidobacteria bacterium]|nr:trigger factor [Acidobacteriota bacterium]
MKAEITELSETRKRLDVEIPVERVDEALGRLARRYARRAKVPGFRPGKVPVGIVRQRFQQDLLHDVAHDLVPPAIDEALRERDLEPIEAPDVRDVSVDDGKPLTFHAIFEVMPTIGVLDYDALTLRRTPVVPDEAATDKALEAIRRRASRVEPVADRAVESGDIVTMDMTRRGVSDPASTPPAELPAERSEGVTVELGAPANPPGFDDAIAGMAVDETKAFELSYPSDFEQAELAGTTVAYEITVRGLHERRLPDLDDEFAKTIGAFETLSALRERITDDLRREAAAESDRGVRRDLLALLTSRLTVEVPDALVTREVKRRLEQIAHQLAQQRVDPRTANVDWEALREEQRAPALQTVRGSLLLDAIAQRETLTVTDDDIDQEVTRYAEGMGQTPAALRAQLEKNNGLAALAEGLRREKTVELLLSRVTIVTA